MFVACGRDTRTRARLNHADHGHWSERFSQGIERHGRGGIARNHNHLYVFA
jgi:hypothetical protein